MWLCNDKKAWIITLVEEIDMPSLICSAGGLVPAKVHVYHCHIHLPMPVPGSEVEQVALENGKACNGFLRAAACAYQQLHLVRVAVECLVGVPFPSNPRRAAVLPVPRG